MLGQFDFGPAVPYVSCVVGKFLSCFERGNMDEWFKVLDLKSGGPSGSNTPPYCCHLDLFSIVPSSTSQLVTCSLQPVGILNNLCSSCNICLFITVSSISTTMLNTFDS